MHRIFLHALKEPEQQLALLWGISPAFAEKDVVFFLLRHMVL
jgi:hypothetical protein